MGISIDKLIVFCKNLEDYHSTRCKRYDDASGYTRSRIEAIRTNEARREEMDSKYYHELKKIVRKYQKIEEIMHKVYTSDNADVCLVQRLAEIREVMEGGNE
jgi:hypothetical protein